MKRKIRTRAKLKMEREEGEGNCSGSEEGEEQEEQEQEEVQSEEEEEVKEELWEEVSLDFEPFLAVAGLRRSQQKAAASVATKKPHRRHNKSKKKGTHFTSSAGGGRGQQLSSTTTDGFEELKRRQTTEEDKDDDEWPSERYGHTAVVEERGGGVLLVWGGSDPLGNFLRDLWHYNFGCCPPLPLPLVRLVFLVQDDVQLTCDDGRDGRVCVVARESREQEVGQDRGRGRAARPTLSQRGDVRGLHVHLWRHLQRLLQRPALLRSQYGSYTINCQTLSLSLSI
jgi:hypothetical protein